MRSPRAKRISLYPIANFSTRLARTHFPRGRTRRPIDATITLARSTQRPRDTHPGDLASRGDPDERTVKHISLRADKDGIDRRARRSSQPESSHARLLLPRGSTCDCPAAEHYYLVTHSRSRASTRIPPLFEHTHHWAYFRREDRRRDDRSDCTRPIQRPWNIDRIPATSPSAESSLTGIVVSHISTASVRTGYPGSRTTSTISRNCLWP